VRAVQGAHGRQRLQPAPGIDCEVGKAFPICVTVGGLAMLLYDRLHGTDHTSGYEEWLDFAKGAFIAGDPDQDGYFRWHSTYYDRDIHYAMNRPENQIPLFWTSTAFQLSVFDRPYAEKLYEGCIRYHGRQEADGSLRIALPREIVGPADIHDLWATVAALACAHEFGDDKRIGHFLSWFEQHYQPTYDVLEAVTAGECEGRSRAEIFNAVWRLAGLGSRHDCTDPTEAAGGVPHLLEPWFCCAEPPAVRLVSRRRR